MEIPKRISNWRNNNSRKALNLFLWYKVEEKIEKSYLVPKKLFSMWTLFANPENIFQIKETVLLVDEKFLYLVKIQYIHIVS